MDWLTFTAQMTGSLAWPLVVVIVIWQLKDKLSELIPRLSKLKHRETEIEFTEKMTELVSDRKEDKKPISQAQTQEAQEQFSFLMKLAEVSPRSAVTESFRVLELAVEKLVVKAFPELNHKDFKNSLEAQKLLRDVLLDQHTRPALNSGMDNEELVPQANPVARNEQLEPDLFYRIRDLRALKNKASHVEDFNLHGMPIEAYIDICLSIAHQLEQFTPSR